MSLSHFSVLPFSFVMMISCLVALNITLAVAILFGLANPAGSLNNPGIQITIEKHLGTSETDLCVINKSPSKILALP